MPLRSRRVVRHLDSATLTCQFGKSETPRVIHSGWRGWFPVPLSIVLGAATARAENTEPGVEPSAIPSSIEVPSKVEPIATPDARRAPSVAAMRTADPPKIDGRLDDAAWQHAPVDTKFTQKFPDEAKPPTEKTELRLLYDDDAIYVA